MSLIGLLRQSVAISASSSRDIYGKDTYATAVDYPARVEPVNELIRDANTREVTVYADVYLAGDADVTTASKIALPDGSIPVIVAVDKQTGGDGTVHHTRVRCAR